MNKRFLAGLVTLTLAGAALPVMAADATAPAVSAKPNKPGKPGKPGKGEKHPEMQSALKHLQATKGALQHAAHDYNGHRAKALELVEQAIAEVNEGLKSDTK